FERRRIGRAVIEPPVELGLGLGVRGELYEFPRQLAVGRALEHAPRARAADRAVPDELDRHALLLQLARASIPDRHHIELAIANELLRLIALAPPDLDVRLDLVELLERAVDVQRIESIGRHAVREQGKNQRARGIIDAQAARARELLDVPEVCPAPGTAVGEFVAAMAKVRALNVGGDAVTVGDDRL